MPVTCELRSDCLFGEQRACWTLMDPNLQLWKKQGESFLSRLQIWVDLLDPTLLLASDVDIQKARTRLEAGGKLYKRDGPAVNLALSCVHPDTGVVLPQAFRPPAFLPVSIPVVVGSFLPHSKVRTALFWQFLLQSYSAGFTHVNRNSSSKQGKKTSLKNLLLVAGTVSYTTVAGALPQILINRLRLRSAAVQTFCRSILPIPLSAALASFSVFIIRSQESETGIQLFDSNGNPVGFSQAAGEKAVKETALSRAALFGLTAAVPQLLVSLLQRTRSFQANPLLITTVRHVSIVFALGLMTPVSFSLFPQLGTIKKEDVEEELQTAADGQFYYHRGL